MNFYPLLTAIFVDLESSQIFFKAFQGNKDLINNLTTNNLTMGPVHFFPFQTDVIVNSVTPSHYFGAGPVSQSILQQAGDEIEREFQKNMPRTSQDSQLVLVTKGFKLSCQYVFHVLWDSESSRTDMVRSK